MEPFKGTLKTLFKLGTFVRALKLIQAVCTCRSRHSLWASPTPLHMWASESFVRVSKGSIGF